MFVFVFSKCLWIIYTLQIIFIYFLISGWCDGRTLTPTCCSYSPGDDRIRFKQKSLLLMWAGKTTAFPTGREGSSGVWRQPRQERSGAGGWIMNFHCLLSTRGWTAGDGGLTHEHVNFPGFCFCLSIMRGGMRRCSGFAQQERNTDLVWFWMPLEKWQKWQAEVWWQNLHGEWTYLRSVRCNNGQMLTMLLQVSSPCVSTPLRFPCNS